MRLLILGGTMFLGRALVDAARARGHQITLFNRGRTAPDLYADLYHKVKINYYPPRGDNKEGWDNIDIFGWLGYPMQIKIDFLCRDSILAAPLVLDVALFLDLAARCGWHGYQDWLSFYYKRPIRPAGGFVEHDLFKQLDQFHRGLHRAAQTAYQNGSTATWSRANSSRVN